MSRLSELIRDLCPDGVEYRPLGEVGMFVRGGGLQKSDFVDEGLPCVHYGQIHTRFDVSVTQALTCVSETQFVRLKHACHGDLLIVTTSEDDAAVGKATAWLGHSEVAISGDMFYYRHSLDPKYVSYFFASRLFQGQKRPYLTGAKVRRISGKGLSNIHIPVPPLEVQQEIVRILDQFTTLEAELEAELKARRKQYEYYREQLMRGASMYETRALIDISIAARSGGTPRSNNTSYYNGVVPWLRTQDIDFCDIWETSATITEEGMRNSSAKWVPTGCVIIAMYGATAAKVAMNCIPLTMNQACCAFEIDDSKAVARYVYHWIASQYVTLRSQGEGSQNNLSVGKLKKVQIPLPSVYEQRRIADILDRFDTLVNDISSGLPAEIAARRKQYEHYRDRLLSFPEKKA